MSTKTKVRKIGNSYGIILPKETLDALHVKEGDTLYLTEKDKETMELTTDLSMQDKMLRIADEFMDRYQNALRELAK